jgi:hypothetical protein
MTVNQWHCTDIRGHMRNAAESRASALEKSKVLGKSKVLSQERATSGMAGFTGIEMTALRRWVTLGKG